MKKRLQELINNDIFTDMLNNMSEYVYIVDDTGHIVFLNDAALKLEKLDLKSVIGKHINEIYVQEESTTLKALEQKKMLPECENVYMIDGKEYRLLQRSAPILDGEEVIGSYSVQRDLTLIRDILNKNINYQIRQIDDVKSMDDSFANLIGNDPSFRKCIKIAKSAAKINLPILLSGFTGSGKELFAKDIHLSSSRSDKPFIAINCAAMPETLLESILFGTVKGTFTGATDKSGLFEQANGGTLFLDEVNSMSLNSQAKLLRVLEEKKVRRLGGNNNISIDVRVISAINTTSKQAIKNKQLRSDLFYRLSVTSIFIPPLAERKNDITLLTDHFISLFNKEFNKNIQTLDKETTEFFMTYNWPGNIRQLKNAIESAFSMLDENENETEIKMANLPPYLFDKSSRSVDTIHNDSNNETGQESSKSIISENVFDKIRDTERQQIINAIVTCGGNISKTARYLNIPRQTLVYRMKKYNIKK